MGLRIPKVESCCCGLALRTGVLILLWLYLINGVSDLTGGVRLGLKAPNNSSSNATDGTEIYQKIYPFEANGIIAVGFIETIVAISGLYAVFKEKHRFLLPYVVCETIDILIILFAFIVGLIIASGTTIFAIPYVALRCYFWIVIYSHYREIKGTSQSSA